jgi:hypothetical protein
MFFKDNEENLRNIKRREVINNKSNTNNQGLISLNLVEKDVSNNQIMQVQNS